MSDQCTAAVRDTEATGLAHLFHATRRCKRRALTSGTIEVEVWVEDDDDDGHVETHDVPYVPGRCHQHQDTVQYKAYDWRETERAMRPEWDKDHTMSRIYRYLQTFSTLGAMEELYPSLLKEPMALWETLLDAADPRLNFQVSDPYPEGGDAPARLRWLATGLEEFTVYLRTVADIAETEMETGLSDLLGETGGES